jgi:hypothetical protein
MYFTPKLSRRVLHQIYLGYPDSAAARGVEPSEPSEPAAEATPERRPKRPARATVPRVRVPRVVARPAKRALRLVPGVHW